MSCYLDTSALAKWYVHESGSEAFERFILDLEPGQAWISSLTIAEMRSLLARHRRMHTFDKDYEQAAWATFRQDIELGVLALKPVEDTHFSLAAELMDSLAPLAPRTLDALHLATAKAHGAQLLASADKLMLRAAAGLGMRTVAF